jgi:hypothetical protein
MNWFQLTLSAMFLVSAVLPIIGLFGLFLPAHNAAKLYKNGIPKPDPNFVDEEFDASMDRILRNVAESERSGTLKNLLLVGAGITLATAASIWSLFPPS